MLKVAEACRETAAAGRKAAVDVAGRVASRRISADRDGEIDRGSIRAALWGKPALTLLLQSLRT